MTSKVLALGWLLMIATVSVHADDASFVNWESYHVHPIEVLESGAAIAVVNTADNRLEVFRVDGPDRLTLIQSIPVGLEPISVRARTAREVWVAHGVSPTVNVVDLNTESVVAVLEGPDAPHDVVFAGGKAFISFRTFNEIHVYDVPIVDGATPTVITLEGEEPAALASNGTIVAGVLRQADNATTSLNHAVVTLPTNSPYVDDGTYPWGINPPPNDGPDFAPPINPDLLAIDPETGELVDRMPRTSMILKQDAQGSWHDDNGMEWNNGFPSWTFHRHAAFFIDPASLDVSYINDLMTTQFAIDMNAEGNVALVGQHAFNHVRFEPNLKGRFISVGLGLFDSGGFKTLVDLNPHLTDLFPDPHSADSFANLPPIDAFGTVNKSLTVGDPRGVAWAPSGAFMLVTGRGSDNLLKVTPAGTRLATATVGVGPTGVVIHPTHDRAYVLNQHGGDVSIVNTTTLDEIARFAFYDPTPDAIRDGRPHLYNTTKSSSLGLVSCASCHVDGDADWLPWDLGDPSGEMKEFNQTCINGGPNCDLQDWHPMKGPMTTQSFKVIIGHEPFHWRGDREDLPAFNPAFESLLGGAPLTDAEMAQFEAMVGTLRNPPNPFRNRNNTLPTQAFNGGNAARGEFLFVTPPPPPEGGGGVGMVMTEMGHVMMTNPPTGDDEFGFGCVSCHAFPTGSNHEILRTFISDAITGIHHLTEVADLDRLYYKDGFDVTSADPISRGAGFMHDGSFDTLITFLIAFFGMNEQDRTDMEAFLFAFSTDVHAGVGSQATVAGANTDQVTLRDQLIAIADGAPSEVGLVAKGLFAGSARGFHHLGGDQWQSDRATDVFTTAQLDAEAGDDQPMTYTLVVAGTQVRMGVDRDMDGFFDQDETDACSSPLDPDETPLTTCCGDGDGDGEVDFEDLTGVLSHWGGCFALLCPFDFDHDANVGFTDLVVVLTKWGPCP